MAYNRIPDLSYYQGNIDFSQVAGNVDFVILRVQHGNTLDSKYNTYVSECKANNIPFSGYDYLEASTISEAQTEATNFYNRADSETVVYAVDAEELTTSTASSYRAVVQAFVDKLSSLGAEKIFIYSGQSFFNTNGLSQITGISGRWIARYGSNTGNFSDTIKPNIACDLWQWTSQGQGQIPGINSSGLDLNVLNGSKPLSYFLPSDNPDPPSGDNPPVVSNYSVTTQYNTIVTGQVVATDTDGDPLNYTKSKSPLNGSATVTSVGNWTYTPNDGFIGNDSFRVLVSDGTGNSATSVVTITVNAPAIDPNPITPVNYSQMFTVVSPSIIYSDQNISSNQIISINNKYSAVYFQIGSSSSNGIWGYCKYTDNQNISYFGWIQLSNIKTKEEIDASRPDYSPEYVQVAEGDTLNSIATANNLTLDQIKLLNGFSNSGGIILTVGQSIRVK